jgi:hypothetical protein
MAFASVGDITARLGVLSKAQEDAAGFLLEGAQAVVEEAAEKTEEELGENPPSILRFVTVEVVCRALANPQGLSSQSETLGSYAHTERFSAEAESGLLLTKTEELLVRRAVHGALSGTVQIGSVASDLCVICQLMPSLVNGLWICGCSEACGS